MSVVRAQALTLGLKGQGYRRFTFASLLQRSVIHSVRFMKTKQLVVRSAVTMVATGLTLLSSGTSQASGRGSSGMRMSGSRGGMHSGAIHQGISSRGLSRGRGADHVMGRNSGNQSLNRGRDDRGGHGERRHGNDDHAMRSLARERQPGDDHGRHRERGDDKGGKANVTRGERERGDDHGRHRERGDDKGGKANVTRGEREPGDDHGGHREREPGDDHGGGR